MDIIDVFIDYVKKDGTDYAILLNGAWGSGKTYFIKKQLVPKINAIPFSGEDKKDKNYKVAYISLNGVGSVEELERRIFIEMNPWIAKKGWGLAGKAISKAFQYLSVSTDVKDVKDVIDIFKGIPRNRVFIFDDLERLAADKPEEILGFINSYTEHHNLKVLILSDESEIVNPERFKKIKEKLIRFTHKYSPELANVFSDLIIVYKKNLGYSKFLANKQEFICSVFERGEHLNLRTLRFVLDIFEMVFSKVVAIGDLDEAQQDKILERYLFFIASYSVKYKEGGDEVELKSLQSLSSDLLNPQMGRFPWFDQAVFGHNNIDQQEQEPVEKNFRNIFEKQFIDEHGESKFEYFPFLAAYVHTGALDTNELQSTTTILKSKLVKKQVNPEQQDLDKLRNALLLDDNDFLPLVERINNYVRQGKYPLESYPIIFENYCLLAQNKVQGISIDPAMVQFFKEGMDRAMDHSEYKQGFNARVRVRFNDPTFYEEIIKYASERNDALLHIDDEKLAMEILNNIHSRNFTLLDEKIKISTKIGSPVFNLTYITGERFFEEFLSMNNSQKNYFVELLMNNFDRYLNYGHALTAELSFFSRLEELIEAKLVEIGDNGKLSTIHLNSLKYWCNQAIVKIPAEPELEE